MKNYAFLTIIFMTVIFMTCHAKQWVKEYHVDMNHIHTEEGCQQTSDPKVITHYVPVKKSNSKHEKRNRTPLAEPFQTTFLCEKATKAQCKILKKAMVYANSLFGSIFDFYEPIIVELEVKEEDDTNYIANTQVPVYYPMKDPNESRMFAYPAPLAKQFLTDIPIEFNTNRQNDIKITVRNNNLSDDKNIQPTIVHELLHGMGFVTHLRKIEKGKIGDSVPDYGNEYYLPELYKVNNTDATAVIIKEFLPLSIYEKFFVDIDDPDTYYFDDSFLTISDQKFDLTMHSPPFITEKKKLKEITDYLAQWPGMKSSVRFFQRSHEPNSVAFRTKDDRVVYLCTFANQGDPDLNHICSKDFVLEHAKSQSWMGEVDHNFVMYRMNVGIEMSNEEKIERFGEGRTIGLLSDDIISMLETMGYQPKGQTDNRVFQVESVSYETHSNQVVDNEITDASTTATTTTTDNGSIEGEDSSASASMDRLKGLAIVVAMGCLVLSYL